MDDFDIYVIEWTSKDRKRTQAHNVRFAEYDDACVVAEEQMPPWAASYRVRMRTEAEEKAEAARPRRTPPPVKEAPAPPGDGFLSADHLMHAVYYLIKRKGGLTSREIAHRLATYHSLIADALHALQRRGIVSTASINGNLFWIDPEHNQQDTRSTEYSA